ncbi:MAG: hypothetical protein QM270_07100 [Bacillota bacterium]|nr:hypothetical protein [Bacillota bacterium]
MSILIEPQAWAGRYEIELLDADTLELIERWELENLLMDMPRQRYLRQLAGQLNGLQINDLTVRYLAIGDGTSAPAITQTKLDNERYRQQVTAKTLSTDRLTTMVSISPFQTAANFRIREIAIFCGGAATMAKDSGLMLSRALVDIEKNSNTILNIMRQDIVTLN